MGASDDVWISSEVALPIPQPDHRLQNIEIRTHTGRIYRGAFYEPEGGRPDGAMWTLDGQVAWYATDPFEWRYFKEAV